MTDYVLELRRGSGDPKLLRLDAGNELPPLSIGLAADWRVEAGGVLDVHLFVYFDGSKLHVQSADANNALRINGRPIGATWTPIEAPCTIAFGDARMVFSTASDEATVMRPSVQMPPPKILPARPASPSPAAGRPIAFDEDAPTRAESLPEEDENEATRTLDAVKDVHFPIGRGPAPAAAPPRAPTPTPTPAPAPSFMAAKPAPRAPRVATLPFGAHAPKPEIAPIPPAAPPAPAPVADDAIDWEEGEGETTRALPIPSMAKAFITRPAGAREEPPAQAHMGMPMMAPPAPPSPHLAPMAPMGQPASYEPYAQQHAQQPQYAPPAQHAQQPQHAPLNVPPSNVDATTALRPPTAGQKLALQWKETSGPKKIILFLLPIAFAMLIFGGLDDDEPAKKAKSKAAAASASASASETEDEAPVPKKKKKSPPPEPTTSASALAPSSASASTSASTPSKPTPPKPAVPPKPVATSPAPKGSASGKTDERVAVDAVVGGQYEQAAKAYDELAKAHPDIPAYKEAARILRVKAKKKQAQ